MAEGFAEQLYSVIERHQHTPPAELERFKALGDSAWVVGDLGNDSNLDFYIDDIQKILKRHGVTPPVEQKVGLLWWLWPATCLAYRDFTVGELKSLVETRVWPDDAFTYERNSLKQKLSSLTVMLVLAALVVGLVALAGFWIVHWLK